MSNVKEAVKDETNEQNVKEVKQVRKPTKEELKERFRKANLEYQGRLTIEDKYKKPDKVLRIDNDDYATRQYLGMLGYTPVIQEVEVGANNLIKGSNLGSEVHIEQGIRMSQPGILYEIDQDLYDARKEVEAEGNDAMLQSTIESAQRPDQIKSKI